MLTPFGDVTFAQRKLQKMFTKHGADLGLAGNWNPGRTVEVRDAIIEHLNSANVRGIAGLYRGMKVTHVVDPTTGLNVILDEATAFVSAWKLSAAQLRGVLTSGRLS